MIDTSRADVDSFCVGPYAEIRINANGTLNFCHVANESLIGKQDNIFDTKLDHYFHGHTVGVVRDRMQRGDRIDSCKGCYSTEQAACISFRQRRNLQAGIFPGADMPQSMLESRFLTEFGQHSKPRFYHVSFSNLCNMACMMCDPKNSTRLQTMYKSIADVNAPMSGPQDWTVGPAWHDFCQHVLHNHDIMCLHVMGGEPMYHKRFRQMIDLLCQRQHTNFHFSVVTNGTIYDQDLMHQLGHFRSVQIEISIESVDRANDYIRHGHKTESVIANIRQYLSNRPENCEVVIRTVPQALSVASYHRLLQFCLDHDIVVDSNVLFTPDFLHCSVLPDDIKAAVKDSLRPYIIDDPKSPRDINLRNKDRIRAAVSSNAQFVISQLDQSRPQPEMVRQRLARFCQSWDRSRQYQAHQYVPELWDFLCQHGYDNQ